MVKKSLKQRIEEEMVVNYEDVLERNFDLANKFFKVTKEGTIKIEVNIKNESRIVLYLVGKLYAKFSGHSKTGEVSNKELIKELSMPEGTVKGRLAGLRGKKKIKPVGRGMHIVPLENVGKILKEIQKKVDKNG